jgi:hypothetical protein
MRWHLWLVVLALGAADVGGVRADEKTVRQELDASLKRYETLFQQSFSLPVKSQEVSALISQQVLAATKAMGFPLQVNISYFTYTYTPASGQAKARGQIGVHLADMAPAQAEAMERQANQLIQGSAVGQALEMIAFDALKEGILYLSAQKTACVLQKETPAAADFTLDGASQQFMPGLSLKETWFRYDRAAKAVTGIQFRFTNGKSILARVKVADVRLPSGATVPVPSLAEITQDALTTPQEGVTVPPKVTVQYGKCTFAGAAPAGR